ncbi:hypothetical protein R1sor_009882 [Riccia sorocarpa]|uniref:Uncharacterized protein n=1 Tax=Riccia sorocarpa TaxID=122646 RepID=A0ABD3HXU5_9MARC
MHGALGRPTNEKDVKVDRDFSQLSVNRFRPVNGLLDKELRLVWTELEKDSVCITKPAKLQGPDDIVTLKDFCKAIKGKRALGTRIVKYQEEFDLWDDLARSYNFPEKWLDGMLKFIPDKPDKETAVEETAVEDVSSSDEEEGSKKKKKSKKKSGFVEPLPSQVPEVVENVPTKFERERIGSGTPIPFRRFRMGSQSRRHRTVDRKRTDQLGQSSRRIAQANEDRLRLRRQRYAEQKAERRATSSSQDVSSGSQWGIRRKVLEMVDKLKSLSGESV